MTSAALIAFFALVVVYSLAAKRLETLNVTGPIIFLLSGLVFDLEYFSLATPGFGAELLRAVAAFTLVLLLFSDASTIDLRALRRDRQIPMRLLLIGLPLTIILGGLVARATLPGLGIGMALLVGSVLAPTDLSLGLAMFSNPLVPQKVRREVNVESGLNDGIAAPLVALAIAIAIAEFDQSSAPIVDALAEIGVGVAIGVAVAGVGAIVLRASKRKAWSTSTSRQFATFALASLSYALALALHGNGFIAAFVGGLTFGAIVREQATEAARFAEESGSLLSLVVWFLFGTAIAPVLAAAGLDWRPIVYAALSLTAIRMIPVGLSLLGSGVRKETTVFIGWFGPRGLASVVFLIEALSALDKAGLETSTVAATAGWTIIGSVVLHGVSAGPVAAWYGKASGSFDPSSPELEPAEAVRSRHGIARPTSASET